MKLAVITLTIGEKFKTMAEMTHPSLKAYAKKIGADFRVIDSRVLPEDVNVMYEKLQIAGIMDLGIYDRLLYLDSDILIKPDCPNLFDVVPIGTFGAFHEGKVIPKRIQCLEQAEMQWGIDYRHRVSEFFNAGVMVFDREHRRVFDPPMGFYTNFGDNTWMVVQAMRHAILFDIGEKFNFMCHQPEWANRWTKAWIFHYAGSDAKYHLPKDAKKL